MFKTVSVFFLVSMSCSLNSDFDYSSKKDLIVVNGIINPDSIMRFSISRSGRYPGDNSFYVIKSADIELYEDGVLIGKPVYQEESQKYTLNYFPKSDYKYEIVVNVPGYPTIHASTEIPSPVKATACYCEMKGDRLRFNNKTNVPIEIRNDLERSNVWLSFTADIFKRITVDSLPISMIDSTSIVTKTVWSLYSGSPYIDKFNGVNDEGLNNYFIYLRLNNLPQTDWFSLEVYSFETDRFFSYRNMMNLAEGLGLFLHLHRPSKDLDLYWKSTMLNYLNSNSGADIPNPFAEQITSYSNVENGTGIFAGYTSTKIAVHEIHCP